MMIKGFKIHPEGNVDGRAQTRSPFRTDYFSEIKIFSLR